jgi:NAD+ diphosphatase
MLHDILPHEFCNQFEVVDSILPDDFILYYNGNKLLLKDDNGQYALPCREDFGKLPQDGTFIFSIDRQRCFLMDEIPASIPIKYSYQEISFLRNLPQKEVAWVGAVGYQLKEWYTQNRFCGKCGAPTKLKEDERAIVCPVCGQTVYPKISPAIIVAIICENKILLAHNTNFRPTFYSLVAGYADVGESLEQTVAREIKEEVGIDVTNIRYYKSQPWPFSGSMMIAFIAEADDRQPIQIDHKEIEDAQWFCRGNLPNHPNAASIAGEILDLFEKGEL